MASSTGISGVTGAPLSDWEHTEQSIRCIMKTPKRSRVMRRAFGSDVPDYVDQKMTRRSILGLYSAAASAILDWEPRFRMTGGKVVKANETGETELYLYGTYYPRGHRGDYSIAESASVRVVYASK
jgi:uncharacterized protein